MDSKITIVLGTRPEIIKMSPIIRACEKTGAAFSILHTGQHYSHEMDRVFFEQLQLPQPDHNLDVGSGPHGAQTAQILAGVERILQAERPSAILVQGDTNSVVGAAIAAAKLRIRVGHVEAGLRSYDRGMPEEINRIIADHVSDLLFAPTERSAAILRGEGIPTERVHVTGNTIVDAVVQNRAIASERGAAMKALGLSPGEYVLMTAHRQENVDHRERFQSMLDGARAVGKDLDLPVVYPIHPRARKMLTELHVEADGIRLADPLDFLGFLELESHARLVLTDSGGVQEEACILGVPCVTLRDTTERPETVEVGANCLAGTQMDRILDASRVMARKRAEWANPFGDGRAAERIVALTAGA